MSRLRIRSALLLGFLTVVVLLTVVAAIIIRQRAIIERSFVVHDRIDTIERWFFECRRQEKNFLLRGDQQSLELHAAALELLRGQVSGARSEVTDPEILRSLVRLQSVIDRYADAFGACVNTSPSDETEITREELVATLVSQARACHSEEEEIRKAVLMRFRKACATTRTVSIVSVAVGLLLSMIVTWLLTRFVAGPLERLRELAEKTSTGNIQDMDIAFSDLEMGGCTNREVYDLAHALRRMVTSLRLLVPNEHGLMDSYHMAIIVLSNRAIGPAAWAMIERARAAAGLSSFTEIDPSNAGRFMIALERQLGGLIPEEKLLLLRKAIIELEP